MTRLQAATNLYDTTYAALERVGFSERVCWTDAQALMRKSFPEFTATFSEGWVYSTPATA